MDASRTEIAICVAKQQQIAELIKCAKTLQENDIAKIAKITTEVSKLTLTIDSLDANDKEIFSLKQERLELKMHESSLSMITAVREKQISKFKEKLNISTAHLHTLELLYLRLIESYNSRKVNH